MKRSTRLHLIMPCSRPHNIPRLAEAYLCADPHPFELRWHILQQGPEVDPKGIQKGNEGMDLVRDGWLWLLADDTVQHPSVFHRLAEAIRDNPGAGAVVFRLGDVEPSAENAAAGHIGCAQTIIERGFLGETRWNPALGPLCDTRMIRALYEQAPGRFVFVDEPLVTMNSLDKESAA